MRILGLDYGSKRIGVAVCDELGLTAQGLPTIIRRNREQVIEAIRGLIGSYGVEKIVIGYPVRLDGTQGIQCEKVNRFASRLESVFALPVIRWDEALTTQEAEGILRDAGMHRNKRKNAVDRLAACLILQNYLDRERIQQTPFLRRSKGHKKNSNPLPGRPRGGELQSLKPAKHSRTEGNL